MVRAGQAGHTPEEMDIAIRQLFQDRLADGQLAESGLTIQELDTIRQAFLRILRGMFHQRIPYPELHAQEAEPEETADDDDSALSREQIEQVS
jgi:membrane-associated HD superfamily phosphohydrolase